MKTRKYIQKVLIITLYLLGIFSFESCVDDNLNEDPKHPSELPSENSLSTALYQFSYYVTTPSVNYNNYNFFVQQWAETTYIDETRYDLVSRNQPRRHYDRIYAYVLKNIKNSKKALELETGNTEAQLKNKLATLEIFELLAWENLVNTFGNIPYSEAFKADTNAPNYAPKYDDAKAIYIDLIARLDKAIETIDSSSKGYERGDIIYYGDMKKWIKTANAIKLRLGINLADTDNVLAKNTIESAYKSGIYASNNEGFIFNFTSGAFSSPVFDNLVASERNDFVPSELLINTMKSFSDPRLEKWFTTVDGEYIGGVFGSQNPFSSKSNIGNYFLAVNAPASIISFTEISFILAEASQRGFAVGGTPEFYYGQAITASMSEAGVSSEKISSYLAKNPYTASDWKSSIGKQAWIALFNRAYAGWNFTRRLDSPILVNPSSSLTKTVPFRMPYSDQEYVLNKANVEAASTAIGGDNVSTKLFWDIY